MEVGTAAAAPAPAVAPAAAAGGGDGALGAHIDLCHFSASLLRSTTSSLSHFSSDNIRHTRHTHESLEI